MPPGSLQDLPPNLRTGANNNPILGGPDRYFDPQVFELPPAGFYGNLGRNTTIGPGLVNLDFALAKNFPLHEEARLQFRVETFNLFNRANFAIPQRRVLTATGATIGNAGRITSTTTSSRQIQFALKLTF